MKEVLLNFSIVFLLIFITPAVGQDTRLMNLCHLGIDRVDVWLKYEDNNYYLYALLVAAESFHFEKGSGFTLITHNNDTIQLIGLLEAESDIVADARSMLYPVGWGAWNKYKLHTDDLFVLRATEIKMVVMETAKGKLKFNVTPRRDWVIMKLLKKLEKKIEKTK